MSFSSLHPQSLSPKVPTLRTFTKTRCDSYVLRTRLNFFLILPSQLCQLKQPHHWHLLEAFVHSLKKMFKMKISKLKRDFNCTHTSTRPMYISFFCVFSCIVFIRLSEYSNIKFTIEKSHNLENITFHTSF